MTGSLLGRLVLAALGVFGSLAVHAHAISTNYLFLVEDAQGGLQATWDLGAADLHWALDLDRDNDGRVTWAEVQARSPAIEQLITSSLRIVRGGARCALSPRNLQLTSHAGEPGISLRLDARCPPGEDLEIASTLFSGLDAAQKTLLQLTTPSSQQTAVLESTGVAWRADPDAGWFATFARFVGQGSWHVWIGYDHIAFLLLLLLPSVLQRSAQGWRAVPDGRSAARDLLLVVTAFTVAHSITLALAATGTAQPPTALVEATIAVSIVAAGILNLFPGAARWRLALAFGFGLMHGFGFANALAELGATGARLVPALAGFNIGVELAQLAIVLLVFPWLLRVRASTFYAARLMPGLSVAVAMAGAVWFVQRIS